MKIQSTEYSMYITIWRSLIHALERSVGRSINYESNGVRCIIGSGRGLERRGNGTDRLGTEKEYEEGDTKSERVSNLNRNSDRYLWKLTEFEVNRARDTRRSQNIHSITKVYVRSKKFVYSSDGKKLKHVHVYVSIHSYFEFARY